MPIDHDRLFKELLATFFLDFLELFLPALHAALDPTSVVFLDKEVFTDVTAGRRHVVDLVARARLRGRESFVLLHVETQARREGAFAARMFRYFARLHEQHGLPVYPVAVLSYAAPLSREPDRYRVAVAGFDVLRFRFHAIQLGRLSWRAFLRRPNPVAVALMARMRIAPGERPQVKAECLRLLATLRLDRARMRLIAGFVDSYLQLTAEEERLFRARLRAPARGEERKMQVGSQRILTSWERQGMARGLTKGRAEGRAEMALQILERRLGAAPAPLATRIRGLPPTRLDALAGALLTFENWTAARQWLGPEPKSDTRRGPAARRSATSRATKRR